MPCDRPAAVGAEPIPMPRSTLPAATAVLISAPLPTSIQLIFALVASSSQPLPLAMALGLVSVKKAMLILSGPWLCARARRGAAASSAVPPRPMPAFNRVRRLAERSEIVMVFPFS